MRPIKVEFQAFGPYVGYEKVDFEAIASKGLFLICGKTGIGKTMILDAMTFALYGKSSGHGRDDFESMRCTNAEFETDTFVKFEFENHGEYYLFERRLERKRKNLSAAYNVSRKGDDGIWHPLMENAKEKAVTEKAVEIIGLEYDQFRQVIVLPQGQFEKLLTSGSDEKEKILTSIFGEEKWQKIADSFYSKADKRKNDLKEIQGKIRNSLAEEKCETISQLEDLVTNKQDEAKKLEEEYKAANYEKMISEQQEILAIVKRFGDLHKAEKDLSELEGKKEERDDWENTLNNARRADNVRKFIEAERDTSKNLQKRTDDEKAAKDAAEKAKDALNKASEEVKLHLEKEKDIEELKEKKIRFESKREAYDGLEEAEKELKTRIKAATIAVDEEKAAKEAGDSIARSIVDIQKEYTTLQTEHEELLNSYLAGITGELAGQLEEGKPCPVCGSTAHPHKAKLAGNSVTKAKVDSKKKDVDKKYNELQGKIGEQEEVKKQVEIKHAAVEKANNEVTSSSERLDNIKKNLVEGIDSTDKLENEIAKIRGSIEEYEKRKEQILRAEKLANEAFVEANTKIGSAEKETREAAQEHKDAENALEKGLKDNNFASGEDAEKLMLDKEKMEELSSKIIKYDAGFKTAKELLESLKKELEGKEEPDKEKCQKSLDEAQEAQKEYSGKKAVLSKEIERLENKVKLLKQEGEGFEERIREAEEDFTFAKKLRGDSGTGLQRYVLGIMFSSVVTAANKMLELVHGGRYRLYRSDDKAQGSNKRGLELKVFDKNSDEHDGRFVSTLSGGEKFLTSLALSIGMSTVAQKSGIKIEALFIDEGFGSLDDESIGDAMSVLNSIQEANGLVGIISHVQILQDQIASKLRVEQDAHGSHIVQTVG
ncbi:MAG: SMC family ATPase [Lachnospiraceae bacterium]|nr:SMC family ATPase [Lachnospiraceae bacterium]